MAGERGRAAEERVTRKGDTEGRIAAERGTERRGRRTASALERERERVRETDGGTMRGGGSCSKPRPVRLTDFMTMAET